MFALGVCAVLLCPALPPWPVAAVLLPVLYRYRRNPVAYLLPGFVWALWRVELVLGEELPRELQGRTVTIEGRVSSLPERSAERLRFVFEPVSGVDFRGRLLLSWYGEDLPRLAAGERWRLRVRLRRPRGMVNPGGFDYEAWLLQRRIRATGYVRAEPGNARLEAARGTYLERLRQGALARLESILRDRPQAALVYALGLGERGRISTQEWSVLRHTGTTHLLAISGLHIGMIALLTAACVRLLWRIWPVPRPAAPRLALFLALPFACLYALLAGFTLPTQRALVMLLAAYTATLAGRRPPASAILALALAAVLVLDPLAPLSAGFWFSFGTVAMLVFGMAGRTAHPARAWWKWGRAQLLASLALLPLMAVWFRQYPLLSLPCNLVAVPWVGFVSLPLTFGGLLLLPAWPEGGAVVLTLASYSLECLWRFLEYCARWSALLLPLPQPPLPALGLGTLCVLLLSLPRGAVPRLPVLAGVLPLLAPAVDRPGFGSLHLALLDVGQGLSVVARTRAHVLVYDTGAQLSARLSAAEAALLPYLSSLGIRRIDRLVVSHADDDHAGVLDALRERYTGVRPWSGEAGRLPGGRSCLDGQAWTWDGVRFEFLHPTASSAGLPAISGNDRSCVLRIVAHGRAILLTGDVERPAELALARRHGRRLRAAVMLVPHHGSRTSSTPAFLRTAQPDIALVSAGYQNRFGFPKADIIKRYIRLGSRVVSTADAGMIEVRMQRSGVRVFSARRQRGRWWQGAGAGLE